MSASTTDRVRNWNMVLWTISVIATLGGWLLGKDPTALSILLGFQTAALGIGEGSNIGKRLSWKEGASVIDSRDPEDS